VKFSLRKSFDRNILFVLAVFGALLLLLLVSPYLVEPGKFKDLSGSVLTVDNQAQFSGINPVAWLVYSFGDLNCHQLKERSYFLNDNQMPMCSRDTGIFIGLFAGAFAFSLFAFELKRRWLLIGLLPLILDAGVQAVSSYESDNSIRVITGAIAGISVAVFICLSVAKPSLERIDPEITSA
jgi:uncharacterized membrane protein